MKMFVDPEVLKKEYAASPEWLEEADECLRRWG